MPHLLHRHAFFINGFVFIMPSPFIITYIGEVNGSHYRQRYYFHAFHHHCSSSRLHCHCLRHAISKYYINYIYYIFITAAIAIIKYRHCHHRRRYHDEPRVFIWIHFGIVSVICRHYTLLPHTYHMPLSNIAATLPLNYRRHCRHHTHYAGCPPYYYDDIRDTWRRHSLSFTPPVGRSPSWFHHWHTNIRCMGMNYHHHNITNIPTITQSHHVIIAHRHYHHTDYTHTGDHQHWHIGCWLGRLVATTNSLQRSDSSITPSVTEAPPSWHITSETSPLIRGHRIHTYRRRERHWLPSTHCLQRHIIVIEWFVHATILTYVITPLYHHIVRHHTHVTLSPTHLTSHTADPQRQVQWQCVQAAAAAFAP